MTSRVNNAGGLSDMDNYGQVNSRSVTSGGYGGTALMDPTTSTPVDTICAALEAQGSNLSVLFELINKLESALGPVLGPPPPKTAGADAALPPSGVRDMVRAHNRSIQYAQARIGELIDRLHI